MTVLADYPDLLVGDLYVPTEGNNRVTDYKIYGRCPRISPVFPRISDTYYFIVGKNRD